MKRFLSYITNACRSERGAITPILMMMSGILLISGVAFLGVGVSQVSLMGGKTSRIAAKYNAEQAVRIALWRMGMTDITDWDAWANFSDSSRTAHYDTATQTLTGIGQSQGVTDSVMVDVEVDTITARMYLAHVILYKKTLTLGPDGSLNYPFDENGPAKLRGWGKSHKSKKIKYKHLLAKSGKFWKSRKSKKKSGKSKKMEYLYTYNGNQTFDGPMEEGIHVVKGNAHMHDGAVLNGTIAATGHITFSGHVEINAIKLRIPSDYKHKKSHKDKYGAEPDSAYLPAVVALRGSDVEQDTDDDSEDMMKDATAHSETLDIRINGMMFSTRTIHLENLTLNGSIVARNVILDGNYNVTFDPTYITPTPAYVEVIIGYAAGPVTWNE